MKLYFQQSDLESWKQDISQYKKQNKETTYKFQKQDQTIQQKNNYFNPILQTFKNKQHEIEYDQKQKENILKNQQKKLNILNKYKQDYNIVNIEDLKNKSELKYKPDVDEIRPKKTIIKPIDHSEDVLKIRKHKKESETGKKYKERTFNVISNKYVVDDENRQKEEQEIKKQQLYQKKEQKQDYNIISAAHYKEDKEKEYQEKRKEENKKHGQDYNLRFPPSWKYKEVLILDQTKPIPQELQIVDQIKQNAQQQYKLKYQLEKEYKEKDIKGQDQIKVRTLNRFNQHKYQEEYHKGYNPITNQNKLIQIHQDLFNNTHSHSLWNKIHSHLDNQTSHTPQSYQTYNQKSNKFFETNQESKNQKKTENFDYNNSQSNNLNSESRINSAQLQQSNNLKIKTGGFVK